MWRGGLAFWVTRPRRCHPPSPRPVRAHHSCLLGGKFTHTVELVCCPEGRISFSGIYLSDSRRAFKTFSNLRWVKMAKLCWTSCSDLWPQAVPIHWRQRQTTLRRCTTSWTSSTRCCITRDSWKTSGSTVKCVCTSACSSACFSRTSSRYAHVSSLLRVFLFISSCMRAFVRAHCNSKDRA